MKTVSFCWSEAWGLQWVWNGNQTWNTAPCNGLDQLHSWDVAGSHRSLCPGQQWPHKTLEIQFVRGKFWWGKNILLAGEVQLFPLCLRICPKVLCCCPYCFCGHFKSLICDPQKGLRILDLNLGWVCTAGSELLHLQVMSHGPAWCHTPQCQTYEPFTTLCLDHSSPNPASLISLCSLWEGRLSPKDREEEAETRAGWFEWQYQGQEPCLAASPVRVHPPWINSDFLPDKASSQNP